MVSMYCKCMINVLCLYFAQKPFSTLSRDACSINSSSVNQERLSVLTKPREFEINIRSPAYIAEESGWSSATLTHLVVPLCSTNTTLVYNFNITFSIFSLLEGHFSSFSLAVRNRFIDEDIVRRLFVTRRSNAIASGT